ncbi:unnamed protein product [Pleuronectes platessa]|uniref:Uncharacterized protein n=1 Tax=Pleuronectes platessa TaxID=8262 RepID=A0A9N7VXJ6_PLEPL|nr:unnamed protein product [Pleuronectes platessa]
MAPSSLSCALYKPAPSPLDTRQSPSKTYNLPSVNPPPPGSLPSPCQAWHRPPAVSVDTLRATALLEEVQSNRVVAFLSDTASPSLDWRKRRQRLHPIGVSLLALLFHLSSPHASLSLLLPTADTNTGTGLFFMRPCCSSSGISLCPSDPGRCHQEWTWSRYHTGLTVPCQMQLCHPWHRLNLLKFNGSCTVGQS